MLYEEAINGRSAISAFFYALRWPQDDETLQNLGTAVSAIVEKRAEFSRGTAIKDPVSFPKLIGEVGVFGTSQPDVDAKNFFPRTQCNSKIFFQLLYTTFEEVTHVKTHPQLDGKLNLDFMKFKSSSGRVEVDNERVQERMRILKNVANSGNEVQNQPDDVLADEDDEDAYQIPTEEVLLGEEKIGDDEDPGVDPPPGETVETDDGFEYLKSGNTHKYAKDDVFDRGPLSSRPNTPSTKVVPTRPMATRTAGHSGLRRPPSELSDDTKPPVAKFTTTEPPAETAEPPPAETAEPPPTATTEPQAEPQAVDATNDAAHVDEPQLIPLDLHGDATAMAICKQIADHGSCVASGQARKGFACNDINVSNDEVTGKVYEVNTGRFRGYDHSPTIAIFKGLEKCFNIEARCDATGNASKYSYKITPREGHKVVILQDGGIFIEKIGNDAAEIGA
jgi:hypothetical protein